MMTEAQMDLQLPEPDEWVRPIGKKKACTRDPDAGPGSCWLWWEGCPKPEKIGCYQHWFHNRNKKDNAA